MGGEFLGWVLEYAHACFEPKWSFRYYPASFSRDGLSEFNPYRENYWILMKGLCEDKRLNEMTHLLYSMFWRISLKGCGEDVVIYKTLLDALCDNGEIDEAVKILGIKE